MPTEPEMTPRVLVIDREAGSAYAVAVPLWYLGYDAHVRFTAETALALDPPPDAVVLSGAAAEDEGLVRGLKAQPGGPPLVVATAFRSAHGRPACGPADVYLPAPIDVDGLLVILDRLGRKGGRRGCA